MASASKGKGRLRGAKGKDYDLLAEFDDKAELFSWAKEQGLFQSGTTKGQWSNNSKKVTTDGIKTFFRCRAFGRKRQQDPPCAASLVIFEKAFEEEDVSSDETASDNDHEEQPPGLKKFSVWQSTIQHRHLQQQVAATGSPSQPVQARGKEGLSSRVKHIVVEQLRTNPSATRNRIKIVLGRSAIPEQEFPTNKQLDNFIANERRKMNGGITQASLFTTGVLHRFAQEHPLDPAKPAEPCVMALEVDATNPSDPKYNLVVGCQELKDLSGSLATAHQDATYKTNYCNHRVHPLWL